MRRRSKKKLSPLYKVLEHHARTCTIFTYHLKPEERHCSCGVEEARKAVDFVLATLVGIDKFIDDSPQIKKSISLLSG